MTNDLRHGTWWDRWRAIPEDIPLEEAMQGRFVRLFAADKKQPYGAEELGLLAEAMTSPAEDTPTTEGTPDDEENPGIPSAYTYFGQFLDHDLTLDPTSSLRTRLSADELNALVDFRTPRFDLDCLYGRGPSEQPYLYQPDGIRLQLGAPMTGNRRDAHSVDVPRGPNGRALIGDPRNDENRIVAQLQSTMLRFHNAVADALGRDATFESVRDQVRWHYQWVIVNDFLPTMINAATIAKVLPHLAAGESVVDVHPRLAIERLVGGLELMPVEFSVAVYRFGHSMIRPIYRLNDTVSRRQIFSTSTDPAGDLGGMRPIPSDWAIDWQFFLDIGDGGALAPPEVNDVIGRTPQLSYKIDTSLVNPLGLLPAIVASSPSSLALRNLLRGQTFELPTGEAIAYLLGEPVLKQEHIVIGKATDAIKDKPRPITDISPHFAGHTPLWTYVLAEAWQDSWAAVDVPSKDTPIRLGPVGGRIIAETFGALLIGDRSSVLHTGRSRPGPFTPLPELTRDGTFGLAELIKAALGRPA